MKGILRQLAWHHLVALTVEAFWLLFITFMNLPLLYPPWNANAPSQKHHPGIRWYTKLADASMHMLSVPASAKKLL